MHQSQRVSYYLTRYHNQTEEQNSTDNQLYMGKTNNMTAHKSGDISANGWLKDIGTATNRKQPDSHQCACSMRVYTRVISGSVTSSYHHPPAWITSQHRLSVTHSKPAGFHTDALLVGSAACLNSRPRHDKEAIRSSDTTAVTSEHRIVVYHPPTSQPDIVKSTTAHARKKPSNRRQSATCKAKSAGLKPLVLGQSHKYSHIDAHVLCCITSAERSRHASGSSDDCDVTRKVSRISRTPGDVADTLALQIQAKLTELKLGLQYSIKTSAVGRDLQSSLLNLEQTTRQQKSRLKRGLCRVRPQMKSLLHHNDMTLGGSKCSSYQCGDCFRACLASADTINVIQSK